MPRSVDELRLWRDLRARNEARLVRTRQSLAAAQRASRIALAGLDAARLALDAARHECGERRREIERDMDARRGMLRRVDFEPASAAQATLDRTIADAQTRLAAARATHGEACRTLSDARAEHCLLLRRREKYRLALDRLIQHESDDDESV